MLLKQIQPKNGTLILDVTCTPRHISFPQDVDFLNEARENMEGIIDDLCRRFDYYVPRMYRRNARKDYLNLTKCKKSALVKRSAEQSSSRSSISTRIKKHDLC